MQRIFSAATIGGRGALLLFLWHWRTLAWPCFRWLSYLMSHYSDGTQHLWEKETYITLLQGSLENHIFNQTANGWKTCTASVLKEWTFCRVQQQQQQLQKVLGLQRVPDNTLQNTVDEKCPMKNQDRRLYLNASGYYLQIGLPYVL